MERKWKTLDDVEIPDIGKAVLDLLAEGDRVIHVGTDSQKHGRRTEFVSVVVVLNPGKGGRVFYSRVKEPLIHSLREKLFKEVWYSVEIALHLSSVLPEQTDLSVHIDANTNVRYRSSSYVKELTGMVVGNGFNAVVKPDSFASSHIAEHLVKYRHVK